MTVVQWHGTVEESNALVSAIANNCECKFGLMGARMSTCVPHQAMIEDQRWLDGLLFGRRLRHDLIQGEWSV